MTRTRSARPAVTGLRSALGFSALLVCGCEKAAPGDGAGFEAAVEAPTGTVAPDALQVGGRYRLARATPVVADLDPGDPAMAMAEPTFLPEPTDIVVEARVEAAGTVWYQVREESGNGVGGWVSVEALRGREVVPLP